MNRYEIFRSLKHLEENASQHELIGVAYGETIDDAASGILYPADSHAPENIIHEYGIKELKCEN